MSRVDDAMRRAAASCAEVEHDTLALSHEPYPIEMPDRHRVAPDRAKPFPSVVPPVPATIGDSKTTDVASIDTRPMEVPPVEPPSLPHRAFERLHSRVAEKVVVDRRMPVTCREQYRRLAAVLHDAQTSNGIKVVMVASAVAGEGKTLTAANVALTLSSSYRKRVLVIDGDLRRPVLHQLFRVDAASGLADGLDTTVEDMKIVVRQVSPTLALLPAGRPNADPMAGLISPRMRRLIEEARQMFDWVIIDTPPLVLLPDAHLLASIADTALLVVKAESTPHAMVKRAVDAIGSSRIVGVVLNNAPAERHGSYDGYGDYYAAATDAVASH